MEREKDKRKFKVSQLLTLYLFRRQHSKTLANVTQAREETNSTTSSASSSAALSDEHTTWTVSTVSIIALVCMLGQ